jgi:hypothetical protein
MIGWARTDTLTPRPFIPHSAFSVLLSANFFARREEFGKLNTTADYADERRLAWRAGAKFRPPKFRFPGPQICANLRNLRLKKNHLVAAEGRAKPLW